MDDDESRGETCTAGSHYAASAHELTGPGDPRTFGWADAYTHLDPATRGSGTGRFREPSGLGQGMHTPSAIAPDPRSPAGKPQARALPATTPSGAHWVKRYPGSVQFDDLEPGFRRKVVEFKNALTDAGATLKITSTYRPPERAYLMHWSWMIVKKGVDPRKIPAMIGVPINWWHGTVALSRAKAKEMVNGYGIAGLNVAPALKSRHTEGRAIDLHATWGGILELKDADNTLNSISTTPRDSTNADLIAVGKTYGVIHLIQASKDKPHWSNDGH